MISNARNEGSVYNVAVNPESGTVAVGTSKSRLAANDGDVLILVLAKVRQFVVVSFTFLKRKNSGKISLS